MKYTLLIACLLSSFNLVAQKDSVQQTEIYFQFKAVKRGFSRGRYNISIDFGQKHLDSNSTIREQIRKKIESFTEIEDVLEYLNSIGRKLGTVYTTSHDHFFTFYYLMKRER